MCTSGRHSSYVAPESLHIIYIHPRPSVPLTNAHRQLLQVVLWTSHSALVLSTVALMVTLEEESCSNTTRDNSLIHLIPAISRHQLALWVVPLYCSGLWPCELQTVHCLLPPGSQRYTWRNALQVRAAILQDSSRDCRGRVCSTRSTRTVILITLCTWTWQNLVHWTDRDNSHQPTTSANGGSHETLS